VRYSPKAVPHAEQLLIGTRPTDLPLAFLDAPKANLREVLDGQLTVLTLMSYGCPVSLRFIPTFKQVRASQEPKGVKFIIVNAGDPKDRSAMRAFVKKYDLDAPYLPDPDERLIKALKARTTTEVFVFDREGVLRYRGPINDQYGIGYTKDEPSRHYLREALEALLAGKPITDPAVTAPGCVLRLD